MEMPPRGDASPCETTFTVTIHVPAAVWRGAALLTGLLAAVPLMVGTPAAASAVPTVPLGTSAAYAVLAASTVTNTGASTAPEAIGVPEVEPAEGPREPQ